MTEAELKNHLYEWARDYCNDPFVDDDGNDDFPSGVQVFVEQATAFYLQAAAGIAGTVKTSESLGDYSISFTNAVGAAMGQNDIPSYFKKLLIPYRRVKML